MPGAASGSSAVAPARVCPLVTVSRLVPSRAISFSSAAWEEAARPRTATIAATPIAMPSADSPARSLRVRSPMLARAARSPGRSRAAAGAAGRGDVVVMTALPARGRAGVAGDGCGAGVGDDVPVEHLDAPPRPGGDRVVVGDDDDRGARRVEFFQQRQDRGAGGRVQVPGRLVGQHHRRAPATARAIATRCRSPARQLGRPGGGPVRQPDPVQRLRRQPPPLGRGGPRRTAARRPRCPARSGARRGRTAGTRTRSGTPAAPPAPGRRIRATSRPVTRTVPAVGLSRVPIRCSSVDLPDPDGPTTATSSPAATARLT